MLGRMEGYCYIVHGSAQNWQVERHSNRKNNRSAVFGEDAIGQHVNAMMIDRRSSTYIMLDRSETGDWGMVWGEFE